MKMPTFFAVFLFVSNPSLPHIAITASVGRQLCFLFLFLHSVSQRGGGRGRTQIKNPNKDDSQKSVNLFLPTCPFYGGKVGRRGIGRGNSRRKTEGEQKRRGEESYQSKIQETRKESKRGEEREESYQRKIWKGKGRRVKRRGEVSYKRKVYSYSRKKEGEKNRRGRERPRNRREITDMRREKRKEGRRLGDGRKVMRGRMG